MASLQLKTGLTSSLTTTRPVAPKGLSGSPLRAFPSSKRSSSTIVAVQSEKPTYQVVQPINGDPFIGSLETPVTSSPLIAWYLSNLPGYRTAVNPLLRGIEVGLAHGFFLVGPFVKAGPLRNTEYAGAAGSLAAGGLVVILSICLTMYGIASFKEGEPSIAPSLTLTGRKKEPDQLQTYNARKRLWVAVPVPETYRKRETAGNVMETYRKTGKRFMYIGNAWG